MNTITDLPTKEQIHAAAEIGRKLSEIYGSVSVAFENFGRAFMGGFFKGLQNSLSVSDLEKLSVKYKRRQRYQRRYERIGRQIKKARQ
jgi:hypothetical protein